LVSAEPVAAGSSVAANTARNTTLRIKNPPYDKNLAGELRASQPSREH
jgi:hypothetical protein